MRMISLAFFAALLAATSVAASAEESMVVKVDHIVVLTEFPEQLLSLMTDTLGLPVSWPLSTYPGFTTGGVHAGNINIEFLKLNEIRPSGSGATIHGIVFEPTSLGENISDLKDRGVDPSEPELQYAEINGSNIRMWTNVMLKGLYGKDYIVYLVEYSPEARLGLSKRVPTMPGPMGKVGLLSIKQIVVGATELNKTRYAWQRFLDPAIMIAADTWQVGKGPAIYLVQDEIDRIKSMVWRVQSLEKAKAFLEETHLLGISTARELSIDPARVQGLDIRLVEN